MSKVLPNPEILGGIKLILCDVDGVLTDGHIQFDLNGQETKTFHVHDAAGYAYWHRSGGLSGFISGRRSQVVEDRARELGVHEVFLGSLDKRPVLIEILARRSLQAHQVAYVGDDLLDLPIMREVGLAVAPADGRLEVLDCAHHVTSVRGGYGVIRETIELVLKAQGKWLEVIAKGGRP